MQRNHHYNRARYNMKKSIIAATLTTLAIMSSSAQSDELFRSAAGDKGTYYLMDMQTDVPSSGFARTTHRRVGPGNAYTDYTITDINCLTHTYRVRGNAEDKMPKIGKGGSKKYTPIVRGSSKSDLVLYSCLRFGEKIQ
jgi:hypothetical protein